jgi:hypothetical protein
MNDGLTERLNQILPTITSDAFLRGKGLGNEIAFYIFDYPPEAELRVREHITFLLEHLPKHQPGLRVCHVNLFDFVLTYLRQRHLLDKAITLHSILKLFQVDITGMFRMTSSARYFKEGVGSSRPS